MSCEQILRDPVLLFWDTEAEVAAHPTILGEAINPNSLPPPEPGPTGRVPPFMAFEAESPNTGKLDFCKNILKL